MKNRFITALSPIIIIFLVLLTSSCRKDDDPKVKFKLPSNIIYKIQADKYGNKWIATEKGLVCFDGNQWNPYPEMPFQNNSKIADLCFSSASSNEVWLAGNKGLINMKFNPGDISSFLSFNESENGLLSDSVSAVAVDASNTKYIGTSKGLSIYKNEKWEAFYGREFEEILRKYPITSVAAAKNGWVYAATSGGGVSCFKYTDAVSGATTYDSDWSGLESDYVNTVIIVDDTCQWYGTNRGASFHISHYTKYIDHWTQYTKADGLVSDTVLAIAKDLSGNMWFGTINGVSRLSSGVFTSFTEIDGLASNNVTSVSIDSDGSVWFGTDNGISHLKNDTFINYHAE